MEQDSPLSETEALLGDVRRNREGAVDALLEHILPDVARSIGKQAGPRLKANFESGDLVQDVALGLVRFLPRVRARDGRTLRALLDRMVRNSLSNKANWLVTKRDQIVRASPTDSDTDIWLDPIDSAAGTPSELAIESERRAWIRLGLTLLDAADQELVLRREFDDESYDTMAADLEITPANARTRTRRARERLANLLERLQRGEAAALLVPGTPE